jgi:hypothetical protein
VSAAAVVTCQGCGMTRLHAEGCCIRCGGYAVEHPRPDQQQRTLVKTRPAMRGPIDAKMPQFRRRGGRRLVNR